MFHFSEEDDVSTGNKNLVFCACFNREITTSETSLFVSLFSFSDSEASGVMEKKHKKKSNASRYKKPSRRAS
jgi:hypothetical protein